MQIGNVLSSPIHPIDRITKAICLAFAQDLAVHAETSRLLYTVPAGKKAILKTLHAHMQITTVGGAGTYAMIRIFMTLAGAATQFVRFCYLDVSSLFVQQLSQLNPDLILNAGDSIEFKTTSPAAAIVSFSMFMTLDEFTP